MVYGDIWVCLALILVCLCLDWYFVGWCYLLLGYLLLGFVFVCFWSWDCMVGLGCVCFVDVLIVVLICLLSVFLCLF